MTGLFFVATALALIFAMLASDARTAGLIFAWRTFVVCALACGTVGVLALVAMW